MNRAAKPKVSVVIPAYNEVMSTGNVVASSKAFCACAFSDVGTGFRTIKADRAKKMKLHGTCLCGTFVLEAHKLGAKITEIPVQVRPRIYGKGKVKTRHVRQFFYVLKDLIF